ncbi:Pre-mRNA-splicing factor [Drechslerella dactyloides]|uniref:Pre-mRNA-splicing factor n=1 Tax=Drechslerella dactyloides TaxID=74499 RepID=A0AAD6NL31_DREDA|nr:Pre-mRNA-splicing factor [Drechslerella dactyloides]
MARNSEKAQSMLFRFREQQAADLGIIDAGRTRRPKAITEITSIPSCEKWRGQVVKEISRKVTKIQDPSLSNYQIRDLNDEINKLMREKHMWEVQLKNLGGPNYMRFAGKMTDENGREIPGHKGYKYFGRARELPGVKELFEELKPKKAGDDGEGAEKRKTLAEIRRNVDANYYGFNRDEEDGTLLAYERKKEDESSKAVGKSGEGEPKEGWEPLPGEVRVPTKEEVMEFLLERKKKKLLEGIL